MLNILSVTETAFAEHRESVTIMANHKLTWRTALSMLYVAM